MALKKSTIVIPFKYAVEMICDRVAAAKVYRGKKYTNMSPYYYWNKHRDNELMDEGMQGFLTEVFELLGAYGEKKVINKEYLLKIYNKHIKKKGKDL